MRFSFIHAADLHLDSPMRGLSARRPELASRFADATRRAFTRLIDEALARKVALMVIAGDVYDGDWKDHGTGLFFLAQLARLSRAGIPVFMIRGNHDAESEITRSLRLPEGVHLFSTRKAETQELPELRVALHGRSFGTREVAENIVQSYPAARPGWFNIGVLHTSLDGRPDHAPYAPCSVADLVARGYDYWALGHIHAAEVVSRAPYIVYPGNLQGRHIRETGPKGALLVEVADGHVESLTPLTVDQGRWARLSVVARGDAAEALAEVEAKLRDLTGDAENLPLAVRVSLQAEGEAARAILAGREEFEAEIQNAAGRVSENIHLEKFELAIRDGATPQLPDLGGIDPVAMLAEAAAGEGFLHEFRQALEEIGSRLPDEVRTSLTSALEADGEAALLAEARNLALARLTGEGPA